VLLHPPSIGTDWIRVFTALGRPFFHNTATNASQWKVPDACLPPSRKRQLEAAAASEAKRMKTEALTEEEQEARLLAEEMGLFDEPAADDEPVDVEAAADALKQQAVTESEAKATLQYEREMAAKREQLARQKAREYRLPVASRAVNQLVEEELAKIAFEPKPYVDEDLLALPHDERLGQFRALLAKANLSAFAVWDEERPRLEKASTCILYSRLMLESQRMFWVGVFVFSLDVGVSLDPRERAACCL
jgi:hypothetical protein